MKPSVGRIVHYTNLGDKDGKYPPQTQAALITALYRVGLANDLDGTLVNTYERIDCGVPASTDRADNLAVDLKVFYNSGFFDVPKVPYSEKANRGHWTWPPRVD